MRSYISKDQAEWDLHLPSISFALRSALHQSIGWSPYRALFGMNMTNHGDDHKLLKETSILEESTRLEREDHLQLIRQEIKKDSRKAYAKNVKQYNLRSKPVSYREDKRSLKEIFI